MIVYGMTTKELRQWCKTMPKPFSAVILDMEGSVNGITQEERESTRMTRVVFYYGDSLCCPHRIIEVCAHLFAGREDIRVVIGGIYRFDSMRGLYKFKLSGAWPGNWAICDHNLIKGAYRT